MAKSSSTSWSNWFTFHYFYRTHFIFLHICTVSLFIKVFSDCCRLWVFVQTTLKGRSIVRGSILQACDIKDTDFSNLVDLLVGAFGMGAQQNTTGSPFGKPAAFGSPAASTGFGFGSSAPQNANPFGANNAIKPFGAAAQPQQQSFLFGGANTSQPNTAFGTGLFANTQNTGTGLFNKPAQPTTGFGATAQNTGFAFNTPASTQPSLFTSTSKPLFGGATNAAPAFGATNNNFGATNTTPFGSTFGKPAAPAFGQTQTSGIGTFGTGEEQIKLHALQENVLSTLLIRFWCKYQLWRPKYCVW